MTATSSAIAAKTVEQVIDERSFGNLSKLVPLVMIIFGAPITLTAFWVEGATTVAAQDAIETFALVLGLAGVGSATAYFGKSQTQLDLQAVRAATTIPVSTGGGGAVGALPADSPLIHGNYAPNRSQASEPTPVVTDPVLPQVEPTPVDESIRPGG